MTDGQHRTLLVVDDEPSMCVLLRIALRKGWEVLGAESAESALDLVAGRSFDVILVDRNLPGMSGIDFVRTVRRRGETCALVMVSGLATGELPPDMGELGISALLGKPFSDLRHVVDALTSAAEAAAARRRAAPD